MSGMIIFRLLAIPAVLYALLGFICGCINTAEKRRKTPTEEEIDWAEIEAHVRTMAETQRQLCQYDDTALEFTWLHEGNGKRVQLTWGSIRGEKQCSIYADGGEKTEALRDTVRAARSELRQTMLAELQWVAVYYDETFRIETNPPLKPHTVIAGFLYFLWGIAIPSLLGRVRNISGRLRKSAEK